jgi:hypothetical protein
MQVISGVAAPPKQRSPFINLLRAIRNILLALSVVGLIATNIATLMSDAIHRLFFDALSGMLYSMLADKASGLVRNSPSVVRKTDVSRRTTVLEAEKSQLAKQASHLEQDRNRLKGDFDTMSESNRKLKVDHDDLNTKHQTLTSDHQELQSTHQRLTTEHDDLRTKHVKLVSDHDALNAKHSNLVQVKARRDAAAKKVSSRVVPRVVHTATRAASSLPAKVVPLTGAAVAIGMTLWDIKDMCDTLRDINEMNEVFGQPLADTQKVCGIKVPSY